MPKQHIHIYSYIGPPHRFIRKPNPNTPSLLESKNPTNLYLGVIESRSIYCTMMMCFFLLCCESDVQERAIGDLSTPHTHSIQRPKETHKPRNPQFLSVNDSPIDKTKFTSNTQLSTTTIAVNPLGIVPVQMKFAMATARLLLASCMLVFSCLLSTAKVRPLFCSSLVSHCVGPKIERLTLCILCNPLHDVTMPKLNPL